MYSLTIVRHGQTISNQEKRFTGWSDAHLTDVGRAQAVSAGKALKKAGCSFDVCFTSRLIRAEETTRLILGELAIPQDIVQHDWHLNERHYGALQDEFRKDMSLLHGASSVKKWRHHYDAQPPQLTDDDPRWKEQLQRLDSISSDEHPRGESMKQAVQRTKRFWDTDIVPALEAKKKVLVVAHTNTFRSLLARLEDLTDKQLAIFRISTATPRHYELDETLKPIKSYDFTSHRKVKNLHWINRKKMQFIKYL